MNLKLRNLFFWLVNFVMFIVKYETLWVIWYHLYNLNKVKVTLIHGRFIRFLKSLQMVPNRAKHQVFQILFPIGDAIISKSDQVQ